MRASLIIFCIAIIEITTGQNVNNVQNSLASNMANAMVNTRNLANAIPVANQLANNGKSLANVANSNILNNLGNGYNPNLSTNIANLLNTNIGNGNIYGPNNIPTNNAFTRTELNQNNLANILNPYNQFSNNFNPLPNHINSGNGHFINGNTIRNGQAYANANNANYPINFDIGGNPFTVITGDPYNPFGLHVASDALEIGGLVSVAGKMPIYGTVSLSGTVPTDGTATVSYKCA